jgi:two-component system response regulator HydG
VDAVAPHDCVVLIEGESGTGKELFARRIHERSPRTGGPFIPVNCAGISESLFESQFYGHERGAFTGAAASTLGVVRSAQDGTLLLDEIGELPLHLQPKLLRMLQQREVMPVGANRPVPVNARFIAATNRSLARLVGEGQFRRDLYHRLNVVRIEIPPLRSRPEDVLLLLDHYLEHYARRYNMTVRHIGTGLRQSIVQYPWPGNVRELCCYVERLYAADLPPQPPSACSWDDQYATSPADLTEGRATREPTGPARLSGAEVISQLCSLRDAEAYAIQRALEATEYNRSAAARVLRIHRSTLLRKMRTYGLDG